MASLDPNRPDFILSNSGSVQRDIPLPSRVSDAAFSTVFRTRLPNPRGTLIVADGIEGFDFARRYTEAPTIPLNYRGERLSDYRPGQMIPAGHFADASFRAAVQGVRFDYTPVHSADQLMNEGWNVVSLNYPREVAGRFVFQDEVATAIGIGVDFARRELEGPVYVIGRSVGGTFILDHLLGAQSNGSDSTLLLNPALRLRRPVGFVMGTFIGRMVLKSAMNKQVGIKAIQRRVREREIPALRQRIEYMVEGIDYSRLRLMSHITSETRALFSKDDKVVDGDYTAAVVTPSAHVAAIEYDTLSLDGLAGKENHDPMYLITPVILPALLETRM